MAGWGRMDFMKLPILRRSRHHSRRHRYELVRCWMAHHQGMSLLSIANFLHDDVVQRWFHSEPRVQATELLLQEKPVAHARVACGLSSQCRMNPARMPGPNVQLMV